MGEQKPRFRFRLPWLLSSAPAPRPAVVTRSPTSVTTKQTPAPTTKRTKTQSSIQPNADPTTPAQRPPFRPPGVAPAQPSPPQAQTSPRTNSQSTTTQASTPTTQNTLETQNPAQLTASSSTPTIQPTVENNNTTTNPTPIPTILAQMPPLTPPRQAAAQNPLPQAQASPKTDTQPSSPSHAGFQSQISSQPLSPSGASTHSQATSHPPSPSRVLPQSQAASQPRSPTRVSPKSEAASQPSSPARPKPQKSSQTVRQPHLAVKPSRQTSSLPSESLTATNVQPRAGKTTQTPSPPKKLNALESSQPTPSSNNPPSHVAEGQHQAMAPPESLEATIQPTTTAAPPSEQSGPMVAKEIPSPKKKSDNTVVGGYPKPATNSDGNPVKTEKWKETTENTTTEAYETSGSIAHTKEQPRVAFQAEDKQLEKQEILPKKEVLNENTSVLNGKQTKTIILHQKDKSVVSESRQKPTKSNGERLSIQKEIRNDITKLAHKMAIAHPGQSMEEKPVSVITLIGENRGASIQLGSESAKRGAAVPIYRGYKINPNESAETTSDGEESSERRRSKDASTKEDQVTKTHLNSNTQGINNSLLFNSSVTERNPGVHLTLSCNPTEPIKLNDESESLKARKAEVDITPSQKLTYEPKIRRRCLRGLLMEPSDSDPENPEKPRRHGCHYSCRDKNKDYDMDAL